ncbi:MAG: NAD(P)H-quinone oxidoreductase [Simkaniaceae bacterium]
MKACPNTSWGNKAVLKDFPTPGLSSREILVKVHASGINRLDILQRLNKYPPPKKGILGIEVSGVVQTVHPSVTKWRPGDRIMGLTDSGGYAQYAAVHEELAMPVPKNIATEEAAALPEAFLTAFQALFVHGHLKPKQNVLIHAGGSGVGTAAVQLAHRTKAHVFITAGSEKKIDFCKKLGAASGWNYHKGPFSDFMKKRTNQKGMDLILDFIGASFFQQNLDLLKEDGTIVCLATLGGSKVSLNLGDLMIKKGRVIGTTLQDRPLDYKKNLIKKFISFVCPLFEQNLVVPVIDSFFSKDRIEEAHIRMKENKNIGKIIITWM